jgi:hypothetical protein
MKIVAIVATLAAVTLATAAQARSMPTGHDAGGPIKQGNFCWVDTTMHGNGWWDSCDTHYKLGARPKSQRDIPTLFSYGDSSSDGGGGGGGGGNR